MPTSKIIYQCVIELHEAMYFATREIGKLYQTDPIIHNYALTYALGLVVSPYHQQQQIPHYQEDLEPLNDAGVYVTPAKSIVFSNTTETWNFARSEKYHTPERAKSDAAINLPLIGHNKMPDIGSTFRFYVYSLKPLNLPHWIRLGKWMSKAELTVEAVSQPKSQQGSFCCSHLLNPIDLIGGGNYQVKAFTTYNMPPVTLIRSVYATGEYFEVGDVFLPSHLEYVFDGKN